MKRNRIQRGAFLVLVLIIMLPSPMCFAQEDTDETSLEDIMDEFDEDAGIFSDDGTPSDTEKTEGDLPWLEMNGSVRFGTCYNIDHDSPAPGQTDWRGFSRLDAEIKLELKAKISDAWRVSIEAKTLYDAIYHFRGREAYTKDIVDNYEKESEILEAYIQGMLSNRLDLKAGRQIVVWGKSDIIRVTDILNPIDNRELGLAEVEDLRLPVGMFRLDYYTGKWNITGIAIPEIRFNKNPEYDSDFYPYATPPLDEDIPSDGGGNTEYAFALNGIFSGWDLSFYTAGLYADLPYVELSSMDLTDPVPAVMGMKHARVNMYGTALNVAQGNWLFKMEAAYIDNLKGFNYPVYNPADPNRPTMTKTCKYARMDLLLGFEYAGFKETTISFELACRHINNYKDRQKAFLTNFSPLIATSPAFLAFVNQLPDENPEDFFQSALFVTRDFLHDTLNVELIVSALDITGQGGAFERVTAQYDVTDSISITGGIAVYQSGSYVGFEDIRKNDRVFVDFKVNF